MDKNGNVEKDSNMLSEIAISYLSRPLFLPGRIWTELGSGRQNSILSIFEAAQWDRWFEWFPEAYGKPHLVSQAIWRGMKLLTRVAGRAAQSKWRHLKGTEMLKNW